MDRFLKFRMSLFIAVATVGFLPSVSQTRQCKLTVKNLFEMIESNSNGLRTQMAGKDVAAQGISIAKSKKLPDINASLSFSYLGNALLTDRDFGNAQGLHSPHFSNSFALEAQQVVYAGGALDAGVRMAELERQQADVAVLSTREQLRFLALGQYLDIYKICNRMKVYRSNIALTEKLVEDIKDKQKQGMALKNDVTRYELQLETLRLALTKLINQRTILNHQLCNTLGLSHDMEIQPDESVTDASYAREGESAWQNVAVLSSPLLMKSSLNVSMAQQNEKLAKSEMMPKVSLVAADNFDGPITFELPPINKNLNIWYFGVGVKYSLSSLFKSNKKVRQTSLATKQMKEAHSVAAERVNNEIQSAYTEYEQSYVELETQKKSVQLATQNYQVMNDRYLSQLALVTDMVDASNIKLKSELLEVDARINIVYAYYKIKYMAGKL